MVLLLRFLLSMVCMIGLGWMFVMVWLIFGVSVLVMMNWVSRLDCVMLFV